MKFTLTFEGELRANGKPKQKWDIRKQFHPQLQELWQSHPSLKAVMRNREIPTRGGYTWIETHHDFENLEELEKADFGCPMMDLCAPVERARKSFFPLVRNSFALKCGLKIVFLRKEEPGKVYQGGDMDNRLKTLFDALSVPPSEQVIDDVSADYPLYCLLEDDSLITSCNIETHRLLAKPNCSAHWVQLLVEVDVRVTQTRQYNQPFLGD